MSKKVRTLKEAERLFNKSLDIANVILAIVAVGVVLLIIYAPRPWSEVFR